MHWGTTTNAIVSAASAALVVFFIFKRRTSRQSGGVQGAEAAGRRNEEKIGLPSFLALGLITAFLALGAVKIADITFDLRQMERAERHWQTVDANVVDSTVRSSKSRGGHVNWSATWTYTYSVNHNPYTANSTDVPGGYDAAWFDNKAQAEQDEARHPPGTTVLAYFDPADPTHSVLDKRTPRPSDMGPLILASPLAACALGCFIFFFFLWRKMKRQKSEPFSASY